MVLIDGSRFANFLDTYKGQLISREKIIRNPEQLRELGIKIPRKSRKKESPIQKVFEAFLLRSFLYQIDENPEYLRPYLITNNWADYAKSWRTRIKNIELHVPFRGKIAFLCTNGGNKKWVCHPESSECVEKIFIELGRLTLPHLNGKEPLFKAEICDLILSDFRVPVLTPEHLKKIREKTITFKRRKGIDPHLFLATLIAHGLAEKKNDNYMLSDEGLFLTEVEKVQGNTNLEKAAKVFLRRDQQRYMHILTVLAWLEALERDIEPYLSPVGKGKKEKQQFKEIIENCGLNIRVVENVVREYSKFGSFIEWYPREYLDPRTFRWSRQYFCFLPCCMDSLRFLSAYFINGSDPKHLFKTELKQRKFERHAEYLLRFIEKDEFLSAIHDKRLSFLKEKFVNSEFLDLNPDLGHLISLVDTSTVEAQCPYNIFLISKIPVKSSFFKDEVLRALKYEPTFRDPQGHFYYPDFRFILASKLGLSFKVFDNILAYELHKDIDFRSRLWLPVLFGVKIRKHRIEDSLLSAIGEPFDSISLRY